MHTCEHHDQQKHYASSLLADSLRKALDNVGVGVEEIITGHAGLAGHTSGDHNNIGTSQSCSELLGTGESSNLGVGINVAQISSDT